MAYRNNQGIDPVRCLRKRTLQRLCAALWFRMQYDGACYQRETGAGILEVVQMPALERVRFAMKHGQWVWVVLRFAGMRIHVPFIPSDRCIAIHRAFFKATQ